ncbi:MAG: D-alanyl-D-alanine carboxypeptidase/D-alanyl-D-alanine-endopeptidase [Thermoanaerobaculia bacterium]|nr:D-alanyl-D-alanine carboxypeptidase/D-alanyl-D-alanine-endopeptidase [Thermoanaerobaculia bacterium]
MTRKALFAFCILHFAFCFSVAAGTAEEAILEATTTRPFDKALWFILIEDEHGTVLHELNSDRLAIPASVRKLFSGSAAAQCLGYNRQFTTEFWIDHGDIVMRGDGDPSFGSDRYGHSAPFAPVLSELKRRRIRSVRDVVADVSLFDRVTIPYQWKVGNLTSDFATPVDAIAYRENEIDNAAVPSPAIFAAQALRDTLREAGIEVTGRIRVEWEPRVGGERIAAVRSPFLQHMLYAVFRNSHNLYAEMLLKRMSAGDEPASYSKSLEIERDFLVNDVGIDESEFRFVDGSGLASDDLVTPVAIVKMLRWMDAPQRRGIYRDLLAAGGVSDGTLRNRFKDLGERVHAKTGSVAGVNALAGIVTTRDGKPRYFAIIVNHHTGAGAIGLIDAIVTALAD